MPRTLKHAGIFLIGLILTGCDAAEVAYTVIVKEKAELLCIAEYGEAFTERTINGKRKVEQKEINYEEEEEKVEVLFVLNRDGSATMEDSQKTIDGRISPRINGIQISFDTFFDLESTEIPENADAEGSLVYDLDLDLNSVFKMYMSISDESETYRMKITTEGKCEHLKWG